MERSIDDQIKTESELAAYEGPDRIVSSIHLSDHLLAMTRNRREVSMSSGIPTLDRYIQTFDGGELTVISGPTGNGKCHGRGTKILMFNGETKNVEDIKLGDLIMGDDSTPREILSLGHGREMLYRIIPKKGESYTVNESHIISLKMTRDAIYKNDNIKKKRRMRKDRKGEIVDISIIDYIQQSKTFKHLYKGYKVPVKFNAKDVCVPPYILGIWLGDGNSRTSGIETMDKEVVEELYSYAKKNNWAISVKQQKASKSSQYSIVREKETLTAGSRYKTKYKHKHNNSMQGLLRAAGLLRNKHIPYNYKINNRRNRLELLAGLIDSDGYVNCGGYIFVNKNRSISEDVVFIARSIGLCATIKAFKNKKYDRIYYRVCISGDCSIIPVRIERKKVHKRKQKKDVLVTAIKIEKMGVGDYFGFEINGNHRYLLGDFTVTHNTLFARSLTSEFFRQDKYVLWFTYEEPPKQFLAQFHTPLPLFLMPLELKSSSLKWIQQRIWEAKIKYGLDAVFIDHLHFLIDMNNKGNMALEIGSVMRGLKSMAIKFNIAIFILVHINRAKLEGEPDVDSLRDSALIGCESDNVLFIWRVVNTETGAVLKIAKNRRFGVMGKKIHLQKQGVYLRELAHDV